MPIRSEALKQRKLRTQQYIQQALSGLMVIPDDTPSPITRTPSFEDVREASRGGSFGINSPNISNTPISGGISEAAHNAAIQKLIAASGGKVKVVSGKRSTKRQAELYAAAIKKYGSEKAARKWVAPPGRSRHESGLATDLGGDLNLAAKLAPQYGLHRPMAHEPWHFELRGSRK